MAVRFVIGRAGTGKTWHSFRAIVEAMKADPLGPSAGGAIWWILPKQATFSAERELTCNSGLNGFARCRVVSFDQLGRDVLQECGGGAVPEIRALGRQMLLGYLLRTMQPQLRFFSGVARQPGLAARLDATFAEFDRCGKDPAFLETLTAELRASTKDDLETTLLAVKVGDFHLLYRAYCEFLGAERVDPHRRIDQVLKCIQESSQFRGAAVYVDGFLEFTEVERRMLAAIAGVAQTVEIALLIDPDSPTVRDVHHLPDEDGLFFRLEEAYRRLVFSFSEAGIKIEKPVALRDAKRFDNPALAEIERRFFGNDREGEAPAEADLFSFAARREPRPPDSARGIAPARRRRAGAGSG